MGVGAVALIASMVDWARPLYSRTLVNQAGDALVGSDMAARSDALTVVNNWRSSHSFPLNTFQIAARRYAPGRHRGSGRPAD